MLSVRGGLRPGGGSLLVGLFGGLLGGGSSVWGISVYRVSVWGGSLSKGGASVQGGLSGRLPCTVKSGRYTSYWNAFLSQLNLFELLSI